MFFQYAWRNLWRNKRRTLIIFFGLAVTSAVLIVTFSLITGMIRQTVRSAADVTVGEVQIYAKDYLNYRSFYSILPYKPGILSKFESSGIGAAARIYGYGLAASGPKSAGVLYWGINPGDERESFDLYKMLREGDFLEDWSSGSVILGDKLAKSLDVRIGSELIAVVQAADGSLGNELLTVTGILQPISEKIDREAAILHEKDFRELFVMESGFHEIVLNSRGKFSLDKLKASAGAVIQDAEITTWRDVLPGLSGMINVLNIINWIYGAILFLSAGLGMINTILMSTFDRIKEFGVLKALGTTPSRLTANVVIEALVLCLAASLAGAAIGIPVALHFQENGINISYFSSGYTFSGLAVSPVWKAQLGAVQILVPLAMMWVICSLSALYPAFLAARMDAVKAMTHV